MDQNLISTVKNTIAQSGYTNYNISQVKLSESKRSSTIIIAINNRCLMTFNQKGNKITEIFSWLHLTSIKYSRPKLKFYFQKNKFSIFISDENVVKSVSEALQRILLSRELRSIGWTGLNLPSLPTSPHSALNRIMEKAHLQKIKIGTESYEKIFSILIYSQPEFYLNDIPKLNTFMDIFLEALPLFSDVYNIAVSKMEKFDPYSVLTQYVSYLKELKRFEIIGPKTDAFANFFKSFSKHQHIHLYSVAFRESNLDEKDLNVIHEFLIGRNIKGVEFHKAIKAEALTQFFQFFFDTDLLNNLISLNFNESNEIDINRLIPKFNNIQVLSLAKCNLEVGDTLRKLSMLTNLKMLDLSNNSCCAKISSMPPNLTSLYLNSVTWSDQTLFFFISHLPNHYITLSMCNAQASPIEWRAFYSYLPTIHGPFGLESFAFDGNPIHSNLFGFLSENNRLSYLSLNGCIPEGNLEIITALCKFISSSKTLEELIIRGSKNVFLGRSVDSVITASARSKYLNYLDISDNKGGDSAVNQLRQLLAPTSNIKTLIFDGNGANSPNLYLDFIRNAIRIKKLKLSFPLVDLMNLLKNESINKQEFLQIKDLFASCDEAGRIFRRYPNYNAFPLYLRKDRVSELSEPIEMIAAKPAPKQVPVEIKETSKKQPNQNQPQAQQNQQDQQKQDQQQQQIQMLQQQLQQQQQFQQQLRQQLQQQQQQQQQLQLNNKNNNNQKRKVPDLKLKQQRNNGFRQNKREIEPTLIVDDDYDDIGYSQYDSYHTEQPPRFDDYDYDYDNFEYSSIENIKKSKLPPRPNSANRYRNDIQPQKSTRNQQSRGRQRPQSSRSQNSERPRRSQSVHRNSDLNNSPKAANRNSTRNLNRNKQNNSNNRTTKTNHLQRSASACQMRRISSNNNRNKQMNDDFDTYITNDTYINDDDNYYSEEFIEKNKNVRASSRNNVRNRNRRTNRNSNPIYTYDYEYDDYTEEPNNKSNSRPASRNRRNNNDRQKRNRANNPMVDTFDDFDKTNNKNNVDDSGKSTNNRVKRVRKVKKVDIIDDSTEFIDENNDDENEILMNKPKPALRTKPRGKNSQIKKSPHRAEIKPAVKELQKQNKMKLRQAQLRQQIQKLEEEEEEVNDTVNPTTTESVTCSNYDMVTKEVMFDDDISNLETTYDIPTWNFPIKLKFEFDDERTLKIEKNYSTPSIIEDILKKQTSKKSLNSK